jgi:hypothetical protein
MRWLTASALLFVAALVSGCAGALDAATNAITATTNLKNAYAADIDLEAALLKDVSIKSAQLSFLSLNNITCGYPSDPYTRDAITYPRTDGQRLAGQQKLAARKKDIESKLGKQFKSISDLQDYATALSALTKAFSDNKATLDKLKAAIDAFSSVPSEEAKAVITAADSAIILTESASTIIESGAITRIALHMEKKLKNAETEITKTDNLKRLTADEMRAFRLWDECAQERLRFIRDFNPRKLPGRNQPNHYDYLSVKLWGEGATQNLELAREYKTYLDEREAFIGKRPDYKALVHAIIEANTAIAHAKPGQENNWILDNLANMGKWATDLDNNTTQLRAGLSKI